MQTDNAGISVVIPTYNRPALLMRCLSALQLQTLDNDRYEVIVVTDGPDPATSRMVAKQFPGVTVLHTEKRAGPAAARNLGWKNAAYNLIAFTDDDTIPDPGWLESLTDTYRHEDEIAYTGRTIVPLSEEPTDYELNTFGLEGAEFITANCCCTRAALQRVNGFDERFAMAWREDSDLHFNLLSASIPVVAVPSAIVVHPVRKPTWGISIREQKKGIFNPLLFKKHPVLYRQRIQPTPLWEYYGMFACLLVFVTAPLWPTVFIPLTAICGWLLLFTRFVMRRLRNTRRTASHVSEMLVTSAVIPVASLFWQFYGSLKFRKLLI